MHNETNNEFETRVNEEQTEVQQHLETIKGYFSVIGSIVIAVLFLILVFIPGLSKR